MEKSRELKTKKELEDDLTAWKNTNPHIYNVFNQNNKNKEDKEHKLNNLREGVAGLIGFVIFIVVIIIAISYDEDLDKIGMIGLGIWSAITGSVILWINWHYDKKYPTIERNQLAKSHVINIENHIHNSEFKEAKESLKTLKNTQFYNLEGELLKPL
jgi:soluble cytochrome b562